MRVVSIGSNFDPLLAVFRGPRGHKTLVTWSEDAAGSQSAAEVRFVAGA